MVVYPEIESWNEFYPSEIFIRLGENESTLDALPAIKIAHIGTTIYFSSKPNNTTTYKKIGVIETVDDLNKNAILLANINISTGS